MAQSLGSLFSNPDAASALETSEIAVLLMVHLNSLAPGDSTASQGHLISEHNFFNDMKRSPEVDGPLRPRFIEAWGWLVTNGLLVRDPGQQANWFRISTEGRKVTSSDCMIGLRTAQMLQRQLLHPAIADAAYPPFVRADYEIAVFKAFRAIEIAVRSAGKFAESDLGTDLMGLAFKVGNGPLTDKTLGISEQKSMRDLFVGSIGLFKNPHSHRHSPVDAAEAAEAIGFASLLMRVVDRLKP